MASLIVKDKVWPKQFDDLVKASESTPWYRTSITGPNKKDIKDNTIGPFITNQLKVNTPRQVGTPEDIFKALQLIQPGNATICEAAENN
ncbi:hypothetical protein SLS62_002104 [Diatrype stigma]|uniref:Uncharacterized protein n=1 Tax=Diatrype stigma TaxID=117547 RepID=A0AAN9V777_9PEZI